MPKVSTEQLLKVADGKYTLLEMAFQRTRQLNSGLLPTIRTTSKKNGIIALQEIAEGKVRLAEAKEEDESELAEEQTEESADEEAEE